MKANGMQKKKMTGNGFLLLITIALFAVMYIAGMIIFADNGLQTSDVSEPVCIQCGTSGYCMWPYNRYDHRRY